jgi:DNA-binding NarL/FixJ family response regulator
MTTNHTQKPIRILVVDDQVVICEGLQVILNAETDFIVTGLAYDGQDALKKIAADRPDIVLMDLKMPVINGLEATRRIKSQDPDLPVLVLTTFSDDEWVFDAIRAGADGYLLKDAQRDMIAGAVRAVVQGKTPIDPAVADKLFSFVRTGRSPNPGLAVELTSRETDVLRLLAQGLTNAQIADKLFLSEGTVRNYVSSILSKLDAADRTQAAAIAWRSGLAA